MSDDSAWLDVAPLEAFEDPGTRGFTHEDWDHWGFVVRVGDALAAYRNVCPHAGHPMNWAPDAFLTPDEEHLICASHGAIFDRLSGECIAGPCPGQRLRAVAVRVNDGRVQVAPAQAAGAE